MNRPGEGLNEDASGILRAIGSLLVALSGGGADPQSTQRLLVTLEDQSRARTVEARPRLDPYTDSPRYPGVRYAAPRASSPVEPDPRPRPRAAESRPTAGDDSAEFILSDARERAQRILEESEERARELLAQRRPTLAGADHEAVEEMKRSIHGLVTEVRDIQQRLGRIESLLIANQAAQVAAAQPQAQTQPPQSVPASAASPRPHAASPIVPPPLSRLTAEPVPLDVPSRDPSPWEAPQAIPQVAPDADVEGISQYATFAPDIRTSLAAEPMSVESQSVESQPVESAPSEPAWEPSEVMPPEDDLSQSAFAPIPSPAPAPPRSSFSVVPPQRREWSEMPTEPAAIPAADISTPVEEPEPLDIPAPPPSAVPRLRYSAPTPAGAEAAVFDDLDEIPVSAPGESGAPIATFLPADGAIILRVTPVSGFQGLMRVQDALARLPSVRQASVEAYSQGEARLRIELLDTTDSEEIASGLGRALRSPASVQEASETDRQLLILLR